MKRKVLVSLLILMGFSLSALGQIAGTGQKSSGISLDRAQNLAPLDNVKTDFHLSMGTSYSNSSYFSGMQNYINPSADIQFSSNLKITTGVVLSNTMNGFGGITSPLASSSSPSGTVYIQGDYQLNDKLTISGSGYREFNQSNQALQRFESNYNRLMNDQGFSLNLHYQLSDNISFEGGIQYNQGDNYYMRNLFYQNNGFSRPSNFNFRPYEGF